MAEVASLREATDGVVLAEIVETPGSHYDADGDADETVGLPSGPKDEVTCRRASMGSSADSSFGPGDPFTVMNPCRQLESSESVLVRSEPEKKSRCKLTGLIVQPGVSLPAVRKPSMSATNAWTAAASTTVARYTTLLGFEVSVSVTVTAVTPVGSGRVSCPNRTLGAEVGVGVKPAGGVNILAIEDGTAGFDGALACPADAQPTRATDVVSKHASCACAKRVMATSSQRTGCC
jgi:hypothetical protein